MKDQPKKELDIRCLLGEGPLWDERLGALLFVDIEDKKIHIYHPDTGDHSTITVPVKISSIAPLDTPGYIGAGEKGIYLFDENWNITPLTDPEEHLPENRFNDGKIGPDGAYWIGSMSGQRKPESALYRVADDGSWEVKETGVTVSNGMAWTQDSSMFYYIDTAAGRVDSYSFDQQNGSLSNRITAVTVPEDMGKPDGMTIDKEDNIWVAHFHGGCITHWDPRTGKLLDKITLPAKNVTSCVFGGKDYRRLYITTASIAVDEMDWIRYPDSGALFSLPVETGGYPQNKMHLKKQV